MLISRLIVEDRRGNETRTIRRPRSALISSSVFFRMIRGEGTKKGGRSERSKVKRKMRRSRREKGWRIGRGREGRVARLASTGLILRPNINNKSFRSLSRGVALNGKRTNDCGRRWRRRRRVGSTGWHVRVFYTDRRVLSLS